MELKRRLKEGDLRLILEILQKAPNLETLSLIGPFPILNSSYLTELIAHISPLTQLKYINLKLIDKSADFHNLILLLECFASLHTLLQLKLEISGEYKEPISKSIAIEVEEEKEPLLHKLLINNTNLLELRLPLMGPELRDQDLEDLKKALSNSNNLRVLELNFGFSSFTSEGLGYLTDALSGLLSHLTELKLNFTWKRFGKIEPLKALINTLLLELEKGNTSSLEKVTILVMEYLKESDIYQKEISEKVSKIQKERKNKGKPIELYISIK
jgi:hypothetical protein